MCWCYRRAWSGNNKAKSTIQATTTFKLKKNTQVKKLTHLTLIPMAFQYRPVSKIIWIFKTEPVAAESGWKAVCLVYWPDRCKQKDIRACTVQCTVYSHRRRINTEEMAKVVAAVWGTEFILRVRILQNVLVQNSLFPKQQQRPLPFLLYLSFFYDRGICVARRPLGLVWFGLARGYCPPSRDSRVGQLSRSSPARYRKSSSRMKKSSLRQTMSSGSYL